MRRFSPNGAAQARPLKVQQSCVREYWAQEPTDLANVTAQSPQDMSV